MCMLPAQKNICVCELLPDHYYIIYRSPVVTGLSLKRLEWLSFKFEIGATVSPNSACTIYTCMLPTCLCIT